MPIPKLSTVPPSPSRSDPDNFDSKGDAFLAHMEKKLQPELNATVEEANKAVASVDNSSIATLIAMQAALAAQAATVQAANAVPWVSGTTYALNAVVISQLNFQTYRKRTNTSVSNTDPANDGTNWVAVGTGVMPREGRSSNVQLERTDSGKYIEIASGTFTQTFAAFNTLGNGWFVYYRNSGTGTVTINGQSLSPGWFGIVWSTGASVNLLPITLSTGYMRVVGKDTGESVSGTTSGTSVPRILNTVEENTIAGASMVGNAISLPPGKYKVWAKGPVGAASSYISFTDGATGISGARITGPGNQIYTLEPTLRGVITLASSKQFALVQNFVSVSITPYFNQGGPSPVLYAEVEIEKVA